MGGRSSTTYYPDRITGDYYCSKEQYELFEAVDSQMKVRLANLATDALNKYDKVAEFLPVAWRNTAVNSINTETSNLPTYVWNKAIMPAERIDHHCAYHRKRYRRRRRNHWHSCWRYSPLVINGRRVDAYFHSRNNNFPSDLNTRINTIQNLIDAIPNKIYNNCENANDSDEFGNGDYKESTVLGNNQANANAKDENEKYRRWLETFGSLL